MTSHDTAPRIDAAHGVLAALLHVTVASDQQSGPDGFRDARALGLIRSGSPRPTAAGYAVLTLLGAIKP